MCLYFFISWIITLINNSIMKWDSGDYQAEHAQPVWLKAQLVWLSS